ncbi:MFS transporter [Roseobacter sinensis]|uniref:MFS transporter n=1 Tax=Roseobacter sinensis TaxID=2931391 RepID=A0ABT3BC09_9RHOB|nr:MFS transporter [Roseobacter sp. WL0113]MCV3271108.1 MFS transporter [Roseobacter sp. WL0113]
MQADHSDQTTPWGLVLALWGAGLGAAAQYGKFSAIFDQLPQIYPGAGAALGLIVSIVGLLGIFLGVVAGVMVARIRYRRALLWALWVGAALSLFQALLPPLPWMLLSRALEGLSHLAIVVATPTLIAQICAPKDRGFALTLWGTFFGVAFTILAWLGLPLVTLAGIPALLAAHGLYMAGFALLLSQRLRALRIEAPATTLSVPQVLRNHVEIYRSPYISAPAIGWLFYTFCFVSILTVLPVYIAPESRAFVMGAMPLISIASSMTLGVALLRIISAVHVILIGFAGSVAATCWLWLAPGLPVACLALAATMGLIQGASFAAVPQLNTTAATQARANGAIAQTGNIGNTLGTPIMAITTGSLGYAGLPLLAGAAFALGAIAHLTLARKRQQA